MIIQMHHWQDKEASFMAKQVMQSAIVVTTSWILLPSLVRNKRISVPFVLAVAMMDPLRLIEMQAIAEVCASKKRLFLLS